MKRALIAAGVVLVVASTGWGEEPPIKIYDALYMYTRVYGPPGSRKDIPKECWEYKELADGVPYYPKGTDKTHWFEVNLKEEGNDGWELVSVNSGLYLQPMITVYYFKRPIECPK